MAGSFSTGKPSSLDALSANLVQRMSGLENKRVGFAFASVKALRALSDSSSNVGETSKSSLP